MHNLSNKNVRRKCCDSQGFAIDLGLETNLMFSESLILCMWVMMMYSNAVLKSSFRSDLKQNLSMMSDVLNDSRERTSTAKLNLNDHGVTIDMIHISDF